MEGAIIAIEEFINDWEERDKIAAILLSGSYAVGNPSKNSDVDLLIILDNKTKWEERGNKLIDGYLVEYIAKPLSFWQKILTGEEKTGKKLYSYMFSIAKVINQKKSVAAEIVKRSNQIVFAAKRPKSTPEEIEMMKYHIHDRLNDLKDAEDNKSPAFNAIYYFLLSSLIDSYAKFKAVDIPSTAKVYKFLKDGNFRRIYKMKGFEDKKLINLALNCYENHTLGSIQELSNYVTKSLGGFNTDNWRLRKNL